MRRLTLCLMLPLAMLVTACGFQLRGSYSLPFSTVSLSLPTTSELYSSIRRTIEASSATRVIEDAKLADAHLTVISDINEKSILSLNSSGRVREFQLTRKFQFKVANNKGVELIPASEITLRREMTYSDDQVLSKEAEEVLIWREIQNDLVQQIMRRLSAAKVSAE